MSKYYWEASQGLIVKNIFNSNNVKLLEWKANVAENIK